MANVVRGTKGTQISIHFQPFQVEKGGFAEERIVKGQKRRYLKGVSSGVRPDLEGERMTENCIKSMQDQGNSGNILLYGGLHGVNFLDDLGILESSHITEQGDWFTEYRLYDESDESVGAASIERARKLWAQVTGVAPYKKPIQKGFSIEGVIPEGSIIDSQVEEGVVRNRVIDDIVMDGVVVVNRPAYGDSVVTAVYKALGELPPGAVQGIADRIGKSMAARLESEEGQQTFYRKWYLLNDMLQEEIEKIMRMADERKRQRLEILLDEFKASLIPLVLQFEDFFKPEPSQSGGQGIVRAPEVEQALGTLAEKSLELTAVIKRRTRRK